MATIDAPRLSDITRDTYQQQLSLDYAKWLGHLARVNLPHLASKEFLAQSPHAVGAAFLKKSVDAWELRQKAATMPGTSLDATWAAPLVAIRPLQDAFVAIARSASLLGRIPGLHRVPFATPIPIEDTSATYAWTAENAPKPISKLAFSNSIKLAPTKCTGIVVVSEELVKLSVSGMEGVLRSTLIGGLTAFTDKSFLDPTSAAIANTRPASVTNGTTPIANTGNLATDVQSLLSAFFTARPNAQQAVLVAAAGKAAGIRALNAGGGVGVDVLVSEAAGGTVVAIDPDGLFVADDGIAIDVSREASIEMADAPTNPPVAATVPTSLWQLNLAGFKVERFVNWQAVAGAVKYLGGVMTQAQCVDMLRELHGLERFAAAVEARAMEPDAAPELQNGLRACRAQAWWLRAALSLESPEQLSMAAEIVAATAQTPATTETPSAREGLLDGRPAPALTADTTPGRIH